MDRRKFIKTAAIGTMIATMPTFAKEIAPKNIEQTIVDAVLERLKKVMAVVGFGNFNIISFDEVLKVSRNYSKVGEFTTEELAFIEELFYKDSKEFGFFGVRTCNDLTQPIYKKDIYKVPGTGHYIFKDYLPLYNRLIRDVGDTLILTSGVRSVSKQLSLFLNRVKRLNYDFSKASYSIAPPGYSYHSVGDFDVGKVGFGLANFSSQFAQTEEFKKLIQLPYVNIRYYEGNSDGVRYEPWHIKVI